MQPPSRMQDQDQKREMTKTSNMDDITGELVTLRDYWRYAISRFNAANLSYGHGTTTAGDDAAFLILDSLDLPIDVLDPFLDARLLPSNASCWPSGSTRA